MSNKEHKENCKKWVKNPNVNPRTNRKIKTTGNVYKKLKEECKEFIPETLSPISYKLSILKDILHST